MLIFSNEIRKILNVFLFKQAVTFFLCIIYDVLDFIFSAKCIGRSEVKLKKKKNIKYKYCMQINTVSRKFRGSVFSSFYPIVPIYITRFCKRLCLTQRCPGRSGFFKAHFSIYWSVQHV